MNSKVLVLMSTYNGEKYINEMLDSILKQKEINIDILIRDDGSTDKTIELINQYNKDNIKLIKGRNKGCTYSFFDLLMDAPLGYDYYAFCDQDDYWLDTKIYNAVEKLNDFPKEIPNLYYSGQIIADQFLNKISIHRLNTKRTPKANFIFNNMAGCTCVFNEKLLQFFKMYYPKNVKEHDNWIYKLCVSLDGNIYADSNEYILYRQHGNNVVGLDNGIKGKIDRGIKQIKNTNPSSYAKEILIGYSEYLDNKSKQFLQEIITVKTSIRSRFKLCFRRDIKFNSFSLRIIFIIKLLIRKI